jgi:acyl-CoA thioesterase
VSAASYAFDVDTAVEAVADHRFAAAISDRWNVLGGRPNGGYVMGVCLQALTRVMPSPDPLVVSAFFLRPVLPGPAEIQTAIVRSGRRISTGEATLYQDGKETLRVTAAFSDLRQAAGRTVLLAARPDLPPPVLELGETGSATIELTVHLRAHPAPGWLACRVATRFVIGGYHEEDFEIWDSTGALVAQSRQLALLP